MQQAEAAVAAAVRPAAAVEPKAAETAKWEMREIGEQETAVAFAALSVLRPMLTDVNRFVEQVNQLQRPQGYRLIGIFEEGKHNAVAVCGFHQAVNLVNGVHTHIDDLVVIPNSRGRGHASRLLKEVAKISQAAGGTDSCGLKYRQRALRCPPFLFPPRLRYCRLPFRL